MRLAAVRLAVVPVLLLLAPATAGASGARAPVSLAASPARVTIAGSGRATIQVTNSGSRRVEVDVRRAAFALDLRGRPRIVPRHRIGGAAGSWLTVRPRRLALPPGTKASLTISSTIPRRARPGDHNALVVLASRPIRGARVAVRMRLGIVVVLRAPGRVSRRLELRRLGVRRVGATRVLELYVANRGNVTEMLQRERLIMILSRGRRILARLQPAARELLARTSGVVQARYTGRVRGRVTAVVELSYGPGGGRVRRTFHIRV
ncbi:MAG: hypothetical protein E6G03_09460 [Actinobacteria bacterium]|nr:MAG: hypothetical protein E6G03_09460 [Actinomycetota bacterium]